MTTNQSKKFPNFSIENDAYFKTSFQDKMQTVKNVLTKANDMPARNGVIIVVLLD